MLVAIAQSVTYRFIRISDLLIVVCSIVGNLGR